MVVRNFSQSGGLELYAHELISGLLTQGIKVTVFCQSNESSLTNPLLEVESIPLRPSKLRKAQRLQHDQSAIESIADKLAGFDIVHSQHYPTDKANVVTFHNHTVGRWSKVGTSAERLINDAKMRLVEAYKIRDNQDRLLCRSAECLVFPARVMQEDFYDAYPFLSQEHKPFVIAYPGASLAAVESEAPSQDSRNQPFTFLFVGRGYRRKGLDIVLAAASKLKRQGKSFKILIAGLRIKPIDRLRLQLFGITDCVEYLGFVKDMQPVYQRAHAGVLTSRVEPFGMAPLQASQFGLVPIVSAVSGVSEVLTDGEDGLILHNHLDAGELARLMERLIDDPASARRLAKEAQKKACELNWQRTLESTMKAYELVLSTKNGRTTSAMR